MFRGAAPDKAIDAVTLVFMGLTLQGQAFSPAEPAMLIILIKVEGGALLTVFFTPAPRRKWKSDETDASPDRV